MKSNKAIERTKISSWNSWNPNRESKRIFESYTFFWLMRLLSLENDVCVMCYFSHCNGKDEAVTVLFKTIVRLKLMWFSCLEWKRCLCNILFLPLYWKRWDGYRPIKENRKTETHIIMCVMTIRKQICKIVLITFVYMAKTVTDLCQIKRFFMQEYDSTTKFVIYKWPQHQHFWTTSRIIWVLIPPLWNVLWLLIWLTLVTVDL